MTHGAISFKQRSGPVDDAARPHRHVRRRSHASERREEESRNPKYRPEQPRPPWCVSGNQNPEDEWDVGSADHHGVRPKAKPVVAPIQRDREYDRRCGKNRQIKRRLHKATLRHGRRRILCQLENTIGCSEVQQAPTHIKHRTELCRDLFHGVFLRNRRPNSDRLVDRCLPIMASGVGIFDSLFGERSVLRFATMP
jgi:hypothetical protein